MELIKVVMGFMVAGVLMTVNEGNMVVLMTVVELLMMILVIGSDSDGDGNGVGESSNGIYGCCCVDDSG